MANVVQVHPIQSLTYGSAIFRANEPTEIITKMKPLRFLKVLVILYLPRLSQTFQPVPSNVWTTTPCFGLYSSVQDTEANLVWLHERFNLTDEWLLRKQQSAIYCQLDTMDRSVEAGVFPAVSSAQ